ncbi:signal recognition particle 14kd protein [Cardiosporidium cionae]|uniref:Signal recognition particle 14 kDa protein n=1 Tax=Cardiosporidium cionae TaxID=476202 RepID=A0ABQ7JFX2_9APIC|nr:signal recognition particle 14kd protein [Cardiosporidium cionae]|eukprot:KAF8822920.1 signal recognition particle 14kd protein [Cardiosporidium cionae]
MYLYALQQNSARNSIWLTFKRSYIETAGRKKALKKSVAKDSLTAACLIRATNGKKKISVLVEEKEAIKFSQRLSALLSEKNGNHGIGSNM